MLVGNSPTPTLVMAEILVCRSLLVLLQNACLLEVTQDGVAGPRDGAIDAMILHVCIHQHYLVNSSFQQPNLVQDPHKVKTVLAEERLHNW
jgi:hypothetical protein